MPIYAISMFFNAPDMKAQQLVLTSTTESLYELQFGRVWKLHGVAIAMNLQGISVTQHCYGLKRRERVCEFVTEIHSSG